MPLNPHSCDFRTRVVLLLRCHFITKTKLSKNAQPTGFPNWRNTKLSTAKSRCQQGSKAKNQKSFGFFSARKEGLLSIANRAAPVAVPIISASDRMAIDAKNGPSDLVVSSTGKRICDSIPPFFADYFPTISLSVGLKSK